MSAGSNNLSLIGSSVGFNGQDILTSIANLQSTLGAQTDAQAATIEAQRVTINDLLASQALLLSLAASLNASCPPYSNGANTFSGCTCITGYSGVISFITAPPFFNGTCSIGSADTVTIPIKT